MRLRIDLAYDGTDFHGWAVQPGLRTVQGELHDGAGHRAAGRRRSPWSAPAAPTPACTRAARWCTSTSTRRLAAPDGRRPPLRCAPAQRHPRPPTCGYAAWSRRRTASTPASARCGAATPTGSPTGRERVDPLTRGARAGLAAPARPGRDERGVGAAASAATTSRRSASSARARPRSAPCSSLRWARDETGVAGRHRARRRVLPQHGALAGRLPDRRSARAGGRSAWAGEILRAGVARPGGHRRCTPTGSPSRRSATRPTTSSPRGPSRPGRSGWPTMPMDEHYFSADPSVPFKREPVTCDGLGPRADADQRLRRLRRRAASTSARRSSSARPSRRRRAGSSTSAAGTA